MKDLNKKRVRRIAIELALQAPTLTIFLWVGALLGKEAGVIITLILAGGVPLVYRIWPVPQLYPFMIILHWGTITPFLPLINRFYSRKPTAVWAREDFLVDFKRLYFGSFRDMVDD